MDALTTTAASGLRSRLETLEIIANNLANAGTAGFKADREQFSTYVADEALEGPFGTYPAESPVAVRHWTDFSQGALLPTGNPLDLALSGPGFFVVETPHGRLFTRNGHFHLSTTGELLAAEGSKVLDREGRAIRVDAAQPVEIDPEGRIRQRGQVIAQLALADFSERGDLAKTASSYFRYGRPEVGQGKAVVETGRLEAANFNTAEAAVRLVAVMRHFEALQKALSLGGEMNRRSIEEVGRARE